MNLWNAPCYTNSSPTFIIEAIQTIYVSTRKFSPSLVWTPTKNGKFSVNSLYKKLQTQATSNPPHHKFFYSLWHSPGAHRILNFSWKCFHEIVPTSERLNHILHMQSTNCVLCNSATKTLNHLLLTCPYTRATWFVTQWSLNLHHFLHSSIKDFIIS